jgi:hypothetical protein
MFHLRVRTIEQSPGKALTVCQDKTHEGSIVGGDWLETCADILASATSLDLFHGIAAIDLNSWTILVRN